MDVTSCMRAAKTTGKYADVSYADYALAHGWSEFDSGHYPDYCCGSAGYAISARALGRVDGLRSEANSKHNGLCSPNEDVAVTGCWAVVSGLRVVAFGEPSAARPPQAALPGPDTRPTSHTWQVARGKARGVGWERVLAIHDTTPKATRFLSRWCGTSGADGGREREREPERERLGPGGCGASEAFKAEAREI